MSLNAHQLREVVVRPVLWLFSAYGLSGEDAEELVMATAAQESQLKHLVQLGSGPALGLWQMEPATHDDVWVNYLGFRPQLRSAILSLVSGANSQDGIPDAEEMIWNLRYGAVMCRLHYRRVPHPLPSRTSKVEMAAYWKKWYNTELGAGTVTEFIFNYERLLKGGSNWPM